jgi:hypothetical protein
MRHELTDIPITDRAGSERLFCCWFGHKDGKNIYRRFTSSFPERGNGWAHTTENLRQNVMHWIGFRDSRSPCCSSGNDNPPAGDWVDAQEHTVGILHIGFLRYLPVLVTVTPEVINGSVARSKIQKEMEFITPQPIDAVAAKVGGKDGR